jgi:hypothetical protein
VQKADASVSVAACTYRTVDLQTAYLRGSHSVTLSAYAGSQYLPTGSHCVLTACKHPPRLRYSKNTIKPYNNYGMCCSCHPSPCMLCPFTLIESAVALIPIRRTFFATGEHKPIGEQLDC